MKYKLLALDIDGTIVVEGTDTIPKRVKKAIQQAAKKVHVSLVSARSKTDLEIMKDLLELPPAYHVLENGAKVMDPKGNILFNLHIPQVEVQEMLNVTNPHFVEVGFCIDNHWINQDIDTSVGLVTGLSFTCSDYIQGDLLKQALENLPTKYYVYIGRHWLDYNLCGVLVFHRDAHKGNGLQFIQNELNILPEETIAVGDTGFDIPMFEYAGIKVAMGNGEESIHKAANVIAKKVTEEGLADIIEKYILNAN
ncbi:MAG TPA: HAD family hydrolase [Candidatus Woesebacteria bacterium]|nr:HAD family hydrolase [Candidatus Woesebacteria bacterium]